MNSSTSGHPWEAALMVVFSLVVLGVLVRLGAVMPGEPADAVMPGEPVDAAQSIETSQPVLAFIASPTVDDGGALLAASVEATPTLAPASATQIARLADRAAADASLASDGTPEVSSTPTFVSEGPPVAEPGFGGGGISTGDMATPVGESVRLMAESSRKIVSPSAIGGIQLASIQDQVALDGLDHMWQTWNNCGPATLAMALSYYGSTLSQADVAAALRPDLDDKNVSPDEMAAFAEAQGYDAIVRVNGDSDRLKLLLSNGFPALIETWLVPEPNNGMGHYRLVTGYDDAAQEWILYDAYIATGVDPDVPYAGIRTPYGELDGLWAVFNRNYLVIYRSDESDLLSAILGDDAADGSMWERSLAQHTAEAESSAGDAFVRFDAGTDLVGLGRFAEAAAAYDQARALGLPWRMMWYQFGPFQAYYEVGRYQDVISLADATLKNADNIEELYYWRGMAQRDLGDLDGARASWTRAVELNGGYAAAVDALAALGPS